MTIHFIIKGEIIICHANVLFFVGTWKRELHFWCNWRGKKKKGWEGTLDSLFEKSISWRFQDDSYGFSNVTHRRGEEASTGIPLLLPLSIYPKKTEKKKKKHCIIISREFWSFAIPRFQRQIYLLIRVGTFSEDMTTTGISLRVDDSCRISP